MRLLYTKPSPYSSKVRMAAVLCGLELELVHTDTAQEGDELLGANPAGKIPALILDDGSSVYDSRVICEHLDRLAGNAILPQTTEGWLQAKRLEALADAVAEAAMLVLYEKRYRPEEKWHQPWTDKQWKRAKRCLAELDAEVAHLPDAPTIGHLALAANLSWVELRFPGAFAEHEALSAWHTGFLEAHPDLAACRPQA